jgi:ribosome-binding protein aMBF1 (putative translation factor)
VRARRRVAEEAWAAALERYHELGAAELVARVATLREAEGLSVRELATRLKLQ